MGVQAPGEDRGAKWGHVLWQKLVPTWGGWEGPRRKTKEPAGSPRQISPHRQKSCDF